jgi:VanZ family protein
LSAGPDPRTTAAVRRFAALLAALNLAAVVWISLRPFTFTAVSLADTVDEFVEFTFRRPIRPIDVIRNVAALIPLGVFLAAAVRPDGRSRGMFMQGARIVAGVAVLSASLEVAQTFVRIRIVSGRDVVAQALGCALGVAAWAGGGARVVRRLDRRYH